jgi:hypothetical protein
MDQEDSRGAGMAKEQLADRALVGQARSSGGAA